MTREEAICLLKIAKDKFNKTMFDYGRTEEALDMAIEALQTLEAVERIKTEVLPQTDLVRCKDCRWQEECSQFVVLHKFCGVYQEISFCSHGERAEQTEYKMPGHDEVMEALDKLTLRGGKDV